MFQTMCPHHLTKSMCSLHVAVLHVSNSHNISNVVIIIISFMVLCDKCNWCYYYIWLGMTHSIQSHLTHQCFMYVLTVAD